MDEWKAIEPGVWKPQKEGDQIVGVLVNKEAKDEARRLSARYLLENETGKLLVWGSAVIDDRMRHVNIGDKIRITYQGKTKNKRSQDVLLYRIEVSRDPVGGFSRPLPPPPACLSHSVYANTHLRILVEISIEGEELRGYYPKVLKGLRTLWDKEGVK